MSRCCGGQLLQTLVETEVICGTVTSAAQEYAARLVHGTVPATLPVN